MRTSTVSAARYGALLARARNRDYPASLQRVDAGLDALLGLTARTSTTTSSTRAWYDVPARRLFLQRRPAAPRRAVLNEVVRALVDQNFDLRRLDGLRVRDHDRWLAARGVVDGIAALASGLRTTKADAGTLAGRTLAAQLRSIGGNAAVASALRTFPQTTEQLLHIDKFLEREPALPVHLPQRAGPATLVSFETFGELDVRDLLQTFGVQSAATAAAGWGGGRVALYNAGDGRVAALLLRWDSPADALEWQAAAAQYVATAFPGATPGTCPPLDRCWRGSADVAVGVFGTTSVLASGPNAPALAAALLTQGV